MPLREELRELPLINPTKKKCEAWFSLKRGKREFVRELCLIVADPTNLSNTLYRQLEIRESGAAKSVHAGMSSLLEWTRKFHVIHLTA